MGSDVFSWRKSSSSGQTGDCVELGMARTETSAVRDSKNPAGPVLRVDLRTLIAFAKNRG